ncbi:hypothetical protein EGK70_012680 [Alcaligenes aquatilis]|uniref:hypothetical protein n=1 Tax=Alcaligenes aquatilis TaxID=323284 RepID=UPI000F680E1D|nr:hypothetical protein [Alcaligenes aquatilis]QXR34724.1 hypothetical protein EGK70_012680 [Alcaligenes aquatilis]
MMIYDPIGLNMVLGAGIWSGFVLCRFACCCGVTDGDGPLRSWQGRVATQEKGTSSGPFLPCKAL